MTVPLHVLSTRDTDLPKDAIPATTETEIQFKLPQGGPDDLTVWVQADAACAVSLTSVAGGVANASKYALQVGVPFPIRFKRNAVVDGAGDKVVSLWTYSTPGCNLFYWVR